MNDNPSQSPQFVRSRYHFGTSGVTYVFVTLLIALGAFNSQNNLLFWAFGFSLALLIVSGFLRSLMLRSVELERISIEQAREGEQTSIVYRLTNRNRWMPAFALSIIEIDRRIQPTKANRKGKDSGPVNWRDHLTGPVAFVAHVGPGQSVTAEAVVGGVRRGRANLSGMFVSTSFPFGIIKKSLLFEQEESLIVHPKRIEADSSLLRQAARLGERGAMPTRRAGAGSEFFSLREYRAGDPMKSIAWSASARRAELLVRQPAAPSPIRVIVALDFGETTGENAEADEHLIRAGAALIELASQHGLEVGLRAPSAGIEIRAREGRLHRRQLLDELAVIDPRAAHRAADMPRIDSAGERAAVIVVHSGDLSDWASSIAGALAVPASQIGARGEDPGATNEGRIASSAPQAIGGAT